MPRTDLWPTRRSDDRESQDVPSHGFTTSIKWGGRSKPGALDYCCIVVFWACALTQLVCGIVIATSANYSHPFVSDPSYPCSNGYSFAMTDCVGDGISLPHPSLLACVDADLCNNIRACYAKTEGSLTTNRSRMMNALDDAVSADLWEALADYWYIPTTIFPSMVVIAVLWLLASEYVPRALVWSTLGTSVVFLIALWAFWNFECGVNNWMLLVFAGLAVVLSAILYKSVNRAAEVMSVAACGLRSTPSIVLVCLFLKAIFVAYVLLWTFFMLRSAQTKELVKSNCSLRTSAGISFARFLFGLLFWVFTYVFLNMKTVVCAAGIGAWYFPGGDGEPTIPAMRGLQWAFTSSSGAVMFAATIVGVTRFILNRIGNACHCLPWFLTPLGCLWKCFTCCCLSVLEAFSKFTIIGQVFAGGSFCAAGRKSFNLIKGRLGGAFITDGVGHTVVTAATYLFSFTLGVATWLWLDASQQYQTLSELNSFLLIPMLLLFAALISTPISTIVMVTWLSPLLHSWTCGEDGCDSTSQANAQRAINSVTGALFVGSVCFAFFHFLADVVLCSIDTVFFCIAVEADAQLYQSRLEGPIYSKLKESLDMDIPSNSSLAPPHCQSTPRTSCEGSNPATPESLGLKEPIEVSVLSNQALCGYTAVVPAHIDSDHRP